MAIKIVSLEELRKVKISKKKEISKQLKEVLENSKEDIIKLYIEDKDTTSSIATRLNEAYKDILEKEDVLVIDWIDEEAKKRKDDKVQITKQLVPQFSQNHIRKLLVEENIIELVKEPIKEGQQRGKVIEKRLV